MITSAKNSQIKEAQKLRRRRNRDMVGLILLEGVRLIDDALRSGNQPLQVFYVPEIINDNPNALALHQRLVDTTVQCLACTPAAFAPLSDTVTPQGHVAIFPRPSYRTSARASLVLILDQIREPGNAGTLLRSAAAAGVEQVLVAPNTVDLYNNKVLRAAMGAHFRLPIQPCPTWPELSSICTSLSQPAPKLYLADASAKDSYESIDWSEPAAIIVGGEADGASAQAVAQAHPIQIPMHGETESLNAGVAGSIILFEAARQRRLKGASA